jgi:hypothetical protein
VLQKPARLTSFCWRDKFGLAAVVVKPAGYPNKRTSIKITRLGMHGEPAPAGTAAQMPEAIGIPVYPAATVQYCGYLPGAAAKTARAQYEVNVSSAEVQRFYRERRRGGGSFSGSGASCRMDWDDESSYVNLLICQPDPALPTTVVFTRVGEAPIGWNTVREDPMRHWAGHRPFGPARYRYDAESGWTSITPPGMYGDTPPPVFGVDLYPGARVQYGTMSGDDLQSSGQILLVTEHAADRVIAFYAQKYQRARPRQQNAIGADGPKTALDWSDRDGIYTVLVSTQRGLKDDTCITIVRTMRKAEAAATAPPVAAEGIAPEQLKLPVYPGARVIYSGYLPGVKNKTAAVEFEVQAPYKQVADFYEAKSRSGRNELSEQLFSTEVKATTFSWFSRRSELTADIRQADPQMPTLVRLRKTDTENSWPWPSTLKSHQ